MRCFVVAGFLLTSASRGPSAIAEFLVLDPVCRSLQMNVISVSKFLKCPGKQFRVTAPFKFRDTLPWSAPAYFDFTLGINRPVVRAATIMHLTSRSICFCTVLQHLLVARTSTVQLTEWKLTVDPRLTTEFVSARSTPTSTIGRV